MKVFGIDFTSAPSKKKPIVCAECWLEADQLKLTDIATFPSFAAFEQLLKSDGPWIAGMDFPFGQPRQLVENLHWSSDWQSYVREATELSKADFVSTLRDYSRTRQPGDKHHFRLTDRYANACSPMMVYGVPVGRMFYEGAQRLLDSDVSVQPMRPTASGKVAVEVYPALVVRTLGIQKAYKEHGSKTSESERTARRRTILDSLAAKEPLAKTYALSCSIPASFHSILLEDPAGDQLDAVLCGLQAAWSYRQSDPRFGIPDDCDSNEGWICDPTVNR